MLRSVKAKDLQPGDMISWGDAKTKVVEANPKILLTNHCAETGQTYQFVRDPEEELEVRRESQS